MKPPRAYARGILAYSAEVASATKAGHFFGGIRRSTLLAYSAEAAASAAKAGRSPSFGGSAVRIHPRLYSRGLLRRRIKYRKYEINSYFPIFVIKYGYGGFRRKIPQRAVA